MKKLFIGLLSLFLVLSPALPAAASVMPSPTLSSPSLNSSWPRLIDEADLLSADEEESLLDRLDSLSTQYECDIIIVTRDELVTGDVQKEADDIYDEVGYGYGEDCSGILFLVSMADREWAISTYGFGIVAFPDEVQSYLTEKTLPYLSDGKYSQAFNIFAVLAGEQLKYARSDDYTLPEIVDHEGSTEKASFDAGSKLVFALIVGLLTGWIATSVMKGKLKSVRGQASASQYVVPGSFGLTDSRDLFLYHTVRRTLRDTGSSSGGNRPGGSRSTVHTSSSGRSHGGSHGKF